MRKVTHLLQEYLEMTETLPVAVSARNAFHTSTAGKTTKVRLGDVTDGVAVGNPAINDVSPSDALFTARRSRRKSEDERTRHINVDEPAFHLLYA